MRRRKTGSAAQKSSPRRSALYVMKSCLNSRHRHSKFLLRLIARSQRLLKKSDRMSYHALSSHNSKTNYSIGSSPLNSVSRVNSQTRLPKPVIATWPRQSGASRSYRSARMRCSSPSLPLWALSSSRLTVSTKVCRGSKNRWLWALRMKARRLLTRIRHSLSQQISFNLRSWKSRETSQSN